MNSLHVLDCAGAGYGAHTANLRQDLINMNTAKIQFANCL